MAGTGWQLPDEVSFKKRMLWWFGIYFGLQLPLIAVFPYILMFPMGISPYFAFVLGSKDESQFRLYGYVFYGIHFLITAILPSRKVFLILMGILAIVASLNMASCMKTALPVMRAGKIEG